MRKWTIEEEKNMKKREKVGKIDEEKENETISEKERGKIENGWERKRKWVRKKKKKWDN